MSGGEFACLLAAALTTEGDTLLSQASCNASIALCRVWSSNRRFPKDLWPQPSLYGPETVSGAVNRLDRPPPPHVALPYGGADDAFGRFGWDTVRRGRSTSTTLPLWIRSISERRPPSMTPPPTCLSCASMWALPRPSVATCGNCGASYASASCARLSTRLMPNDEFPPPTPPPGTPVTDR